MSNNIENNGSWLYFDYKYIGEKVNEEIFQVCCISYIIKYLLYFIYLFVV